MKLVYNPSSLQLQQKLLAAAVKNRWIWVHPRVDTAGKLPVSGPVGPPLLEKSGLLRYHGVLAHLDSRRLIPRGGALCR
jgi:hypothetical protein